MLKRTVSEMMLTLLLTSMLTLSFSIQPAKASGTTYIRADGSIDPPTAPIQRNWDVYTLTGNITSDTDGIVIERDNIVVDGAGYSVQGPWSLDVRYSGGRGISLSERSNVTIRNMEIKAFLQGILLMYSSGNTISGNNITDNMYGIHLKLSSNNNSVVGNTFTNDGLVVYASFGNRVDGNFVNGKPLVYLEGVSDYSVTDAGQVILVDCDNIRVENLDLSHTTTGLDLWGTTNSKIADNNMTDNNQWGIYLYSSSNNSIVRNNITNNPQGFWLLHSNNNNISENIFNNDGLFVSKSYLNVVEGNVVNGKPLVYLEGVSGHVVDNAGQVILVNSSDITVENLDLSNAMCGIELWGTNNTIVRQNNITNNYRWGIWILYFSSNNSITGNNITDNGLGIEIDGSSNNSVVRNNITNNLWGIYLYSSSNNSIVRNSITNNSCGVGLEGPSNNKFYHNNFINNTEQVHDYSWDYPEVTPSVNAWDNDYPSGGNYWSDYNGTDLFRGPYQNETGSDGIGDTPYTIDANNTDRYPLVLTIPGDLNHDYVVDIYDAITLANAYNSKLGDANWNATADLNNDNIVDIYDAIILANNYGKTA